METPSSGFFYHVMIEGPGSISPEEVLRPLVEAFIKTKFLHIKVQRVSTQFEDNIYHGRVGIEITKTEN